MSCSSGDHSVKFLKKIEITTNVTNLINKSNNLNEETPLHLASSKNNHKAIEWLLANNVNVNIKNYCGRRPDQLSDCDRKTKTMIAQYRKGKVSVYFFLVVSKISFIQ